MSELDDIVQRGLKVAGDPSLADEYRQTMAAAGIDATSVPEAPDPGPVIEPISLESVVDIKSKRSGVLKESLPMRYIRHWTQPGGGRYPGYLSFMLIDVWHPALGRQVLTHSYERNDHSITPLGEWARDTLKKGDVFQVGELPTKQGFTIYRPITVG